jgi:hypothetical protein
MMRGHNLRPQKCRLSPRKLADVYSLTKHAVLIQHQINSSYKDRLAEHICHKD